MDTQKKVTEFTWYETLRVVLEPFRPAASEADADHYLSTLEIISSIESHHGVPQGPVGKEIFILVHWNDFVRAMHYLGYREANAGGTQLHWLLKRK